MKMKKKNEIYLAFYFIYTIFIRFMHFFRVFSFRLFFCNGSKAIERIGLRMQGWKHKGTEIQPPEQTITDDNKSPYIFVCHLWLIVTFEFSARTSIVFSVYIYLFVIFMFRFLCFFSFPFFCIHSLYTLISFDLFRHFFALLFAHTLRQTFARLLCAVGEAVTAGHTHKT